MAYDGKKFLSNRKKMVKDEYSLPPRKSLICRWTGTIFLLCAAALGIGTLLSGIFPGPKSHCGESGCTWSLRPSMLLEEEVMRAVQASPTAERRFDAYAARPLVRAGIAGVTALDDGPFALILLCVGLALRRLGGKEGQPLAAALPWLRRAALMAVIWAIGRPVSDSLMVMLLSPGTPEGGQWAITIDLLDIGSALMLGIAAFATVWAIEAGLKAQRDLDRFV